MGVISSRVPVLHRCQRAGGRRDEARRFHLLEAQVSVLGLWLVVRTFGWVVGPVMFCARAELGLCEAPGKCFVACSCL